MNKWIFLATTTKQMRMMNSIWINTKFGWTICQLWSNQFEKHSNELNIDSKSVAENWSFSECNTFYMVQRHIIGKNKCWITNCLYSNGPIWWNWHALQFSAIICNDIKYWFYSNSIAIDRTLEMLCSCFGFLPLKCSSFKLY